jgi:uncharacterized protein YndB with AHSA1/START domain
MTRADFVPPVAKEPHPDYQKTIWIKASPDAVFDAITSLSGLTAWWTHATGSSEAGGELRFLFDTPDPCVMRVDEALRPTSVQWTVTECAFLPDWVGTRPTFAIIGIEENESRLEFRHHGLTSQLDCIDMCRRGWDHFIESLCDYVESGHGSPFGSAADTTRRL